MNFKLTISMAIFLAGVIASVLIINYRKANPVIAKYSVIDPEPAEIVAFSYLVAGGEEAAFTKTGNRWVMTAPVTSEVTDDIKSIADDIRTLAYVDKFEVAPAGDHSLESTGLKAPLEVVKFTDDKGVTRTLEFGHRSRGKKVFAKLDGGKTIYAVRSNPAALLQNIDMVRQRGLLKIMDKNTVINRISITNKGSTVEITPPPAGSTSDRRWLIVKPTEGKAGREADIMATRLTQLDAAGFTYATRDIVGLVKPRLSVTATISGEYRGVAAATHAPDAGGAAKVTIHFGDFSDAEKSNIYAAVGESPEVFLVPRASFEVFNKSADDLRDRHVIPEYLQVSTAREIILARGNDALTISRIDEAIGAPENGEFKLTTGKDTFDANSALVGSLLSAARNLAVSDFLTAGDPKSLGLDPPQRVITFTLIDGTKEELLIGATVPPPDDKALPKTAVARRTAAGMDAPVLVNSAVIVLLDWTATSLRSPQVEKFVLEKLAGFTVDNRVGGKSFALARKSETEWSVTVGKNPAKPADLRNIFLMMKYLLPLEAGTWLRTARDPSAEKGDGDIIFTVTSEEPPAAVPPGSATPPAVQSTRTIRFFRHPIEITPDARPASAPASAPAVAYTWTAIIDPPAGAKTPASTWVFIPKPELITSITETDYLAQPATAPASAPAQLPGIPMPEPR